jgi:PAS domain S-box-containing protein
MLQDFNLSAPIIEWLNDYTPQGIIITDAEFIVRGWNRWLETHTGRKAEETLGQPLLVVFPELVLRGLDEVYQKAREGQTTVLAQRFHRYLVKLPARPEFKVAEMQQSARVSPLISNGQVVGTITSIEDVTERAVRETQLLKAREEADSANEAKDRFLAVLSHDLRTPLSAILGWARIFRDSPVTEQLVRKGAEVIERNAVVQLQLIEEILDISRITAAKLELDLQPVEVREMIRAAVETLEPMAKTQGIDLESVMPHNPGVAVLDSKRFQQIVWNLVSNSLKFTPDGGSVRATLDFTETFFRLRVADTGKGIPAESLPHVFEPLWQAKGSTGHGGLGLGLAIVKSLVELHGGSIRAESAGEGKGATFILEVPWTPARQSNRQTV